MGISVENKVMKVVYSTPEHVIWIYSRSDKKAPNHLRPTTFGSSTEYPSRNYDHSLHMDGVRKYLI